MHFVVSRSHQDRDTIMRTIGPVWDGNEVWLLAGGGTLYFAFPLLYASSFSGFYLPLMIVLWLLILRGIGIELRSHFHTAVWPAFFDGAFAFSSILLAIFLGAALANVLRGVPLNADGYFFAPLWTNWRVGPNPGILDWYTVIGGLVALVALGIHGSLYLAVKTSGALQHRARRLAQPMDSPAGSHRRQPGCHHPCSARYSAKLSALPRAFLILPAWRFVFWGCSSIPAGAEISLHSSAPPSICRSCLPEPLPACIPCYCHPAAAHCRTSPSPIRSPVITDSQSDWYGGLSELYWPLDISSSSIECFPEKLPPPRGRMANEKR